MKRLAASVCVLWCAALLVAAGPASAQDRLVYDERWPRFRSWEYAATGVLLVGGLAMEHLTHQPREPNWTRPILFDDPTRDALLAETRRGREVADIVSDVTWLTAQWYTQVVDVGLVTFVGDENFDVAWQMSMMNAEAMALAFVLTRGSHRLVARTRPLRRGCSEDDEYDGLCPFPGNNAGFISGHTSMAAVGAGLTCAHHRYLPLYGGGTADLAACLGVSAVAGATGVLRLVADRHYVSDVIAGYLVGFAVGYGVPVLLHYRHGAPVGEYGQRRAALGSDRNALAVPVALGWSGSF